MRDKHVETILKEWKKECLIREPILYTFSMGLLRIFTTRPGIMIGRAGITYNKYNDIMQNTLIGFKGLEFVEAHSYVLDD